MTHSTTVSLTARADMQEPTHNKSFPEIQVSLGDQHTKHQFTKHAEQHRFTIVASLDTGPHDLTLEFMSDAAAQSAIEVTGLEIHGVPMGMRIYQCRYTAFGSEKIHHGHLYMGWPGRWEYTLQAPTRLGDADVGLQ